MQLHAHSLPNNHILHSLKEPKSVALSKPHVLSLGSLSKWQCELIKGPVVNIDHCFNRVFPSFDPFNPEFVPRCKVIDTFSNCFSFHLFIKHKKDNFEFYIHQLDCLAIESSSNLSHALIITDASIKNNITTFISHIYIHNKPLTKTLYHAVNITSTEAEIFAIRYSINKATNSISISKIIVVTNSIHTARKIFDPFSYPFQGHVTIILKELQIFFSHH